MSDWQRRSTNDDLDAAWQELAEQAKEKPWLLKLLAEHGTALAARYALWMGRLRRLRQGERRRLQRRLGVGLAGAALLLALAGGPAGASPANTITVSGACDLIEAIHNANDTTTGQPYTDCAAGDPAGGDSIYLTGAVTLTAPNNTTYGPTGLPVVTSEITIEGNGNTIARSGATVDFRILAVGSGGNLTLNSATVSGGVASASTPGNRGGGLYAVSATLAVTNSTLSGNSAIYGGGMYASFATAAVSNSTLSGNSARYGGGLYARYGTLAVTSSTLSGNSARYGGGIWSHSATATVTNSTLSGNSADYGGGIQARYGTVTVQNSTLSGSSAKYGGGLYARSVTLAVTSSTLSGNSAQYDGGGLFSVSASVAVTNSTLSGNSAGDEGGGLYARADTVTVANSTLSGNSASDGGGLYARSAAVGVSRSLVSGNTAGTGNEVYSQFSTVTAASYNLFGHDGETDAQAFYDFAPGATDINATSDGISVALAAILNTTLADNDSTVVAGAPPGAVVQTLALPDGSPAMDKAPSADCVAPILDFDQRAKPRNANGDGSASSNECDIGAFELQAATGPVPRIVIQKQTRPDGDATPFKFNLRGPISRSFTLTDNGIKGTGQIPAGIYTLEEILPPGWTPAIPLDQLTCDDGSPISAIDLGASEVVVCRFLNYKGGNLIVKKVTIPPVASPSFAMRLINNTTSAKQNFSLANDQQFDSGPLDSAATYKLLETAPGGWKKKNIVCDNGSPSTAIAPTAGATVTCTVTNENTAPSNILLSNSSVLENKAIGTVVGNLSAADSVGGDTHTFSFVNDGTPAAANNGNFQIAGNQLQTAKKFDFEQKSSHTIKLQVTDSAGQTRVKAFVISVGDGPG